MSPRQDDSGMPEATVRREASLAAPEEQRIDSLIRELPRIDPSANFEAAFWARLAREQARLPQSVMGSWWSRWRLPLEILSATAAVALFAVWITPRSAALPDSDWRLVADGDRFEILLDGDLDLLASLDVVEAWDGSEGG